MYHAISRGVRSLVGVLVLAILAGWGVACGAIGHLTQAEATRTLDGRLATFEQRLSQDLARAAAIATHIARDPATAQAVAHSDRAALHARYGAEFAALA